MLADAYLRSGKVRDLYRLSDDRILLVASDRLSAFDVVLPTPIPDKGRILTGLSRFWFGQTAAIVPNHLLATDPDDLDAAVRDALRGRSSAPPEIATDGGVPDDLAGRIMICRAAAVVPVEAVVRGYLAGSGWKEYRERGSVCGVGLPSGLREGDRLPEPIFTPATKAEAGAHDENISFDRMVDHLERDWPGSDGPAVAERVRELALRLYRHAAAVTERAGIILADTKFEFGVPVDAAVAGATGGGTGWGGPGDGLADRLLLVDEALTPDSSRFWEAATYEPGRAQASFDKQFVRDWLETQPWDKTAPGPDLPAEVVDGTRARYVEAFERISGGRFDRYLQEDRIAP